MFSGRYNSEGRAFPDISAQSVNYIIRYGGNWVGVAGTSCSCPLIAGMIALINDARLSQGKSSLGFINPALYKMYAKNQRFYFNDVVRGSNGGCDGDVTDKHGYIAFTATKGWDPVTGVGTPKFKRMYDYLLNLGN